MRAGAPGCAGKSTLADRLLELTGAVVLDGRSGGDQVLARLSF